MGTSPTSIGTPGDGLKTQYRSVGGNRLHLYTDGDDAFEAAFQAMQGAKERVWLETYIFEPDEVGDMARGALVDAARRGCSVILLIDRWGSPKIDRRYIQPILEAGGRAAVFNPILPWRKIGRKLESVRHRDHRKLLITDDVGFCGGANVSLDYGGPGPELFFDLTLQAEGPVVQDMAAAFLDTLLTVTGDAPPVPPRPSEIKNGSVAQVLALSGKDGRRDLDLALENALELTADTCLVMTPYLIPPDWFVAALTAASRRGADVRLMTAGRTDVPLARMAGRHLYEMLLRAGVRIFELQHPNLHAKSLTIDGRYSIVGSYNVDVYGSRHNLEIGIASTDAELARRLEVEFDRRTAQGREIYVDEWRDRPAWAHVLERLANRLLRL